jgi:hypothetical protein
MPTGEKKAEIRACATRGNGKGPGFEGMIHYPWKLRKVNSIGNILEISSRIMMIRS